MSLSKNEIKFLKSLQQKKFRDKEALFVVEGLKLVEELTISAPGQIHAIYTTDENIDFENLTTDPVRISEKELERISGLKKPNKVLAVVKKRKTDRPGEFGDGLVLLLDNVKDPGNLGTILRTADWFNVQTVICSPETVDLYNPKVVQSSMGSIFRINVLYKDLNLAIDELKNTDFELYGADMEGHDAFSTVFPKKTAFIMGSESHGLSAELGNKVKRISIPRKGQAESLNVSMAAGILMSIYAAQ